MDRPRVLEVVSGPLLGRRYSLEGLDSLVLGRGKDCRISFRDDKRVSRHHCKIVVEEACVRIHDLGSQNGTWVNGLRFGGTKGAPGKRRASSRTETVLWDGDEIRVGRTLLVVRIPQSTVEVSSDTGTLVPGTTRSARGSSEPTPPSGPRIEGYEMVRKIAEGGYGTVFLARREEDGATVAIKLLQTHHDMSEKRRTRFLREIAVMERLRHPHLVPLLASGATPQGGFYFVMEYCPGGNLKTRVREEGALDADIAAGLILDALDGLRYAHGRQIVHRDIKPSNILLAREEGRRRAKLADLGLAKDFLAAGLSGMTETGAFAGTFDFMPREQLVDFRFVKPVSDLWSMGATLYWLVTARLPRDPVADGNPTKMILHSPVVPLLTRDPGLPPALARVVERALRVETTERYQSAGEMAVAIREAVEPRWED